jgi:ATP-dependent DNA helicase RecG
MKRRGVFCELSALKRITALLQLANRLASGGNSLTHKKPLALVANEVTGLVTPQVTPEVTLQVSPEVAPEVIRVLSVLKGAMDRRSLQVATGIKAEKNFRLVYLRPALDAGLIEMTHPDKPRSSKQKYRLTDKGRQTLGERMGGRG